ncbi:hypothetical protein EVAR_16875_1 [Eumeta japonica]|uniref:Uncharacterized protein n=1 Tax=Eumeta variegata TaxID=151549 RepID=A0A4C1V1P9_EUMVA|nr:hypothetical protein EVAR_16875_1 [Eumeta japonica]
MAPEESSWSLASVSDRTRISDERGAVVEREVGHRNPRSLDESQQRKRLLRAQHLAAAAAAQQVPRAPAQPPPAYPTALPRR